MTETAVGGGLSVDEDDSAGAKEKAAAAAGAAQEQAGQLAGTAKEQAANLAGTAKEQAASVVGTATEQAQSVLSDAQNELSSQASAQKERAVSGLRALSSDLASMAENAQQPGLAAQAVSEAAKRSGTFADFLDEREPGHLLDELRHLGRRRTGAFLLGAAVLGFASGRLLKGARADNDSEPEAPVDGYDGGAAAVPGADSAMAQGDAYPVQGVRPTEEFGPLARTPHLLPADDV